MTKQVEKEGKKEYVCEECGYGYATKELAVRCESWCAKNRSCNLEITAQGMPPKEL